MPTKSIRSGVTGADSMIRTLKTIAKNHPQQVAMAIYKEAQVEVTEMKRRTPVDTTPKAPHPGNLRNSIHVEAPEIVGDKVSVTIATGKQAPYAIYVHENPDAFHPIGQYKFMESVLNESRPFMAGRIAQHLDFAKLV